MRKKSLVLVSAAALGLASLSACGGLPAVDRPHLPAGPYVLENLVLIDGTGAVPRMEAAVLVNGGRIQEVGSTSDLRARCSCARVDLKGAYLLPGFINAHVHGAYSAPTLHTWLSAGVTSVRDLGPFYTGDFVAERNRLGRDPGNARIISATPLITRPGGYGNAWVDGVDSARAKVRDYAAQGVDLIKVAIEDDLQGRTWPMLSQEEISAIVQEAHAHGLRVSAHVSHVRNLPLALNAGVDDLAHMVVEPLPPGMARDLIARGIAWVPTLELWKGVSEKHQLDWIRVAVANTGLYYRAGGTIALGTDFQGYTIPFDAGFPITEARLLAEAGLPPLAVITAGTRNAALVSGRLATLGTVEPGKVADLVVLRANPLVDLGALEHPILVIKDGRAVTPAAAR